MTREQFITNWTTKGHMVEVIDRNTVLVHRGYYKVLYFFTNEGLLDDNKAAYWME